LVREQVNAQHAGNERYAPQETGQPLPALDRSLMLTVADEGASFDSSLAVDDLKHQIRSTKSAATEVKERQAQKWYVEGFIEAGFEMRRHQCADAAMKVYGLCHRRSRQLYDLTLLEIRRILYTETKHSPVIVAQLQRSKNDALLRFSNFCTPEEFLKLVALMRDLPASLVTLIKPANQSPIRAGNWPAVRENLELILEGDPRATKLFAA
jgi:hypothetical protein